MHTAPTPCAVTSAAVPNFSSSNTLSATRGSSAMNGAASSELSAMQPTTKRSAGVAAHEARTLAGSSAGSTCRPSASVGGRRNEATTANTAKKLSVLMSERELVAAESDDEPGERGPDHAPEVPLRRRQRDRAGSSSRGTRSGSIAW